jgi:7,8-dihydroneopterin aldolase/epimerase/oxygenase
MDKVIIKNLIVRGIIGIYDWEREKPQEIRINITAFTDISKAAATDEIQYSVNYKTLAKKVQHHAETAKRLTVEALAEDIASLSLENELISKVIVLVEKPGAVRFSESVGVEIERSR